MDYSNDAGLPCFCPHEIFQRNVEIQDVLFTVNACEKADTSMCIYT